MSRQERVDCASLAVILATLLLFAGSLLPTASAAPSPSESSPSAPQPAVAASDWQPSEPEPSGIRGLTVDELLQDAWSTHDTLPAVAPSGQYTAVEDYVASYDGAPAMFPGDYFTLESKQLPGVYHVFHVVMAQRA